MSIREDNPSTRPHSALSPSISVAVIVCAGVLFSILAVGGGYWHHRQDSEAHRSAKYRDLKSIAEHKCFEIAAWRQERVADARTHSTGLLRTSILQRLKSSDKTSWKSHALERMRQLADIRGYDNIIVAGTGGGLLLSLDPRLTDLDSTAQRLVSQAAASRGAVLGDFFRCPVCNQVHIDVAMSILDADNRVAAVLILRSNAERYLYPLIESWPTGSKSSETLLVHRDGGDVLFLNQLRHRSDPALTLRIPMSRTNVPAVHAVLGKTGVFEGLDYRGIEVLADMRLIPGSTWFMIAKVDKDEMLAEARYHGRVTFLFVVFLILIGGVSFAFALSYRRGNIYKKSLHTEQALRKSQGNLEHSMRELAIRNKTAETFLTVSDEEMYPQVLSVVLEVLESPFGVFGYIDENGALVALNMTTIVWDKRQVEDKTIVFPRNTWSDSAWPTAIREKRTICDNNASTRVPAGHVQIRRHISHPLIHKGQVVGLFQVANKESDYSEEDAALLRTIGDIVAPVLDARRRRELQEEARKRAEAALKDSETRYRRLFESAKDGILILDADTGRVDDANPFMAEMLGYSHEEFLGKRLWELSPFKSVAASRDAFTNLQKQGYVHYEVPSLETRDGKLREVELVSNVYLVDHKSVIQCNIRDVTERKQAEMALRESEEKYRILFESSSDAIMLLDDKGFFDCNAATIRMFGCATREEFCSKHPGEVSPPTQLDGTDSKQAANERIATAFRDGRNFFDWIHRRANGEDFSAEVMLTSLEFKGKRVLQASVRDITERRQLEEQILQSQKMEAVGQLAGGVAHDFNNLLTVILGYAQMLMAKVPAGSEIYHGLSEILLASQRAADLTRQLLMFSRKQIVQPQVIDLNNVLKGLDKMLHRLIRENINVLVKHGTGLRRIMADPGQVEQVIINLVVNASDAMPKGGRLILETTNIELDEQYAQEHVGVEPGRYVMLAVTDTGMGMSRKVQGRIFEPFFTTKPAGKGTGLGLPTVYGIVKKHGGSIGVYSEVGIGTAFKVYLPAIDTGEEAERRVEDEVMPSGSETVLVVEDDDSVRRIVVRTLSDAGYTSLEASSGSQAMELLEGNAGRPDLLITDVIMPGMSGEKVAAEFLLRYPEAKVLYVSGYTSDFIHHDGMLDTGVELLQKPFTPLALAQKVRNVLDNGGNI